MNLIRYSISLACHERLQVILNSSTILLSFFIERLLYQNAWDVQYIFHIANCRYQECKRRSEMSHLSVKQFKELATTSWYISKRRVFMGSFSMLRIHDHSSFVSITLQNWKDLLLRILKWKKNLFKRKTGKYMKKYFLIIHEKMHNFVDILGKCRNYDIPN